MFPACAKAQCNQRNPWFANPHDIQGRRQQRALVLTCHFKYKNKLTRFPGSSAVDKHHGERFLSPSFACWRGPTSGRFEKGRWPCYAGYPWHKACLLNTLFKREILVWGHMSDIVGERARVSCPSGSPFLSADSNSSFKMSSSKKHSATCSTFTFKHPPLCSHGPRQASIIALIT